MARIGGWGAAKQVAKSPTAAPPHRQAGRPLGGRWAADGRPGREPGPLSGAEPARRSSSGSAARYAASRSASATASSRVSTTGTPGTVSRLARLWDPPV
ncbi:hypothetical protein GCM10027075_08160 [Streptomyces heilongjiangensis]